MNAPLPASAIADLAWPANDTEAVATCPVCASASRHRLHEGLRDITFQSAPGAWTLVDCDDCGCAYLERRPTPATIGRAYATYYTHEGAAAATPQPAGASVGNLRKALANGYRNRVYGSRLRPSLGVLGTLASKLSPSARGRVEREAPGLLGVRPPRPGESRLLDIGSGSGRLLKLARSAGWVAMGVEPDPSAAAVAREGGIEIVAADVGELPAAMDGSIDRIVLSHVIEHVYDPGALLRHCRRLLKPDGVLWLETPNLDSAGHEVFGADWRGLEPPRHLVLFRRRGLTLLLRAAGFSRISPCAPRDMARVLFEISARIRVGRETGTRTLGDLSADARASVDAAARQAQAVVCLDPERAEYITLEARP